MDKLLLFTIDEPFTALHTDGLLLTILIDELSPQHRWTSSYYLRLMSPSLRFKQTGSLLLFTWTSSYNSLPDELFLTALPDELLLFTWTSSYNSLPDELFLTTLPDELLLFTWTSSFNSLPDELFLTALPDELPLFTWTSSYNGST